MAYSLLKLANGSEVSVMRENEMFKGKIVGFRNEGNDTYYKILNFETERETWVLDIYVFSK